jgi:ABC-type iron transport system FetAB ATPase subunit
MGVLCLVTWCVHHVTKHKQLTAVAKQLISVAKQLTAVVKQLIAMAKQLIAMAKQLIALPDMLMFPKLHEGKFGGYCVRL